MPVTPDNDHTLQEAITAAAQASTGLVSLAVSGGGDSIAMMHLAAKAIDPARLSVFTINHNLRDDAHGEIALVRSQASKLGLQHRVADWHWDGVGNLQASARSGRWEALGTLARRHEVGTIWMAHTEDDQIETFLMRLARGSGVDGLSGMAPQLRRDGVVLARPLLGVTRQDLRSWLEQSGIGWCDDPSNDDTRFDRVRARQMADRLSDLGLTRTRVLQTVEHMQTARRSLRIAGRSFVKAHYTQDQGDLILTHDAFDLLDADVPRRAFAAAIQWVSGGVHKPRFAQLLDAASRMSNGTKTTFSGCLLSPEANGSVRLAREAHATSQIAARNRIVWDGRWLLSGPDDQDVIVKALGDAVSLCPDWRDTGLPRTSLLASPSVWQDDVLIAAPVAGFREGWTAQIVADFHSWAFAIED